MGMKTPTLADTLADAYHNGSTKFSERLETLRPAWERGQMLWETIEREHLDPLLDWALTFWGDRRSDQQRQLGKSGTVSELTADERQIHRSLYVSALSFGLASAGVLFFPPLRLLSLPGILYVTWQTYQRAYESLAEKRTVDIAVFTAFVNTAYVVSGYWVLGALGNTTYFFSLKLLSSIKDRFAHDLESALIQNPPLVWIEIDGQEVQRPLDTLAIGDILVVHAGELIPVDGVVRAGSATVDQHVLTGEARPVEKSDGDEVLAATIVLTGTLHITLTRTGMETTVGKLSEILAQTIDFRSGRQLFVQRLTDWLILPFAGLAAFTWSTLGFSSAAAVIDAHPHRSLNILGGLSLLNYLVVAAEEGILIKDAGSLEMLSKVDTVIFDKTGTLTQEQPQLLAIHLPTAPENSLYGEDEVLAYAAAAEVHQSHPIARAILAEAAARQLISPTANHPEQDASYHAGFGVQMNVDGRHVHVGSTRFMQQEGIAVPPEIAYLQETSERQGHSLTMVALDGQLAGVLELQAVLRPEAEAVLRELRELPQLRSMVIISGDRAAPTRRLAQEIGADDFYAEVLPAGKAELVVQLQQSGRTVCFVGDGINDAFALKQANVSISLQGATAAATDTAHIVLMEGNLQQLLPLFAMAKDFDDTSRRMMVSILGAGTIGLIGIFGLGFDLRHMMILDQISTALGTGVAMRPRLTSLQRGSAIATTPAI